MTAANFVWTTSLPAMSFGMLSRVKPIAGLGMYTIPMALSLVRRRRGGGPSHSVASGLRAFLISLVDRRRAFFDATPKKVKNGAPWLTLGPQCAMDLPDRAMDLPDRALDLPDRALDLPDRALDLPDRAMDLPDRALDLPDRALDLPDRALDLPDRALDLPDRALDLPDRALDLPDRALDLPDRALDLPDRALDLPDRALDLPDRALDLPDRALDLPDRAVGPARPRVGPARPRGWRAPTRGWPSRTLVAAVARRGAVYGHEDRCTGRRAPSSEARAAPQDVADRWKRGGVQVGGQEHRDRRAGQRGARGRRRARSGGVGGLYFPLVRYHGVFGARSSWRALVTPKPPDGVARRKKSKACRDDGSRVRERGAGPRTSHRRPARTTFRRPWRRARRQTGRDDGDDDGDERRRPRRPRPAQRPSARWPSPSDDPTIIAVEHWRRFLDGELYAASSRVEWALLLRRTLRRRCPTLPLADHGGSVMVAIACIFRLQRGQRSTSNPKVLFSITAHSRRLDHANNAPSSTRPQCATEIIGRIDAHHRLDGNRSDGEPSGRDREHERGRRCSGRRCRHHARRMRK